MEIPKMWLKQLFYYSKWVLQEILSLTVLLNCVSGNSNFDIAFLPDCTKFCCVFLGYRIGNLMKTTKMYLKQLFYYSKWV